MNKGCAKMRKGRQKEKEAEHHTGDSRVTLQNVPCRTIAFPCDDAALGVVLAGLVGGLGKAG